MIIRVLVEKRSRRVPICDWFDSHDNEMIKRVEKRVEFARRNILHSVWMEKFEDSNRQFHIWSAIETVSLKDAIWYLVANT